MSKIAMIEQYEQAKSKYPDTILLYHMAEFFESFFDDAIVVSKALGIVLLSRDKSCPMVGIPCHRIESCLRELLAAGHKVAIIEPSDIPTVTRLEAEKNGVEL